MAAKKLYTSKEAAEKLGIKTATFRLKAKEAKLKPAEFVKTGKRGRPACLWTFEQITQAKG